MSQLQSSQRCPNARPASAGFSLVELLMVIVIIALVIGITLPALSAARKAARSAATSATLNDLSTASVRFEQDKRRAPGYLSIRDVGGQSNTQSRGMTAMENALLDLAGKNAVAVGNSAPSNWNAADAKQLVRFSGTGPDIWVNPTLIGSGDGNYWVPPAAYLVAQYDPAASSGTARPQVADDPLFGGATQIPDVVDAFGQPVLAWVQDDLAISPMRDSGTRAFEQFAQKEFSSGNADSPARFYWRSNAAFLTSTAMGKQRVNNADNSLLGNDDDNAAKSLMGLLGNPGAPLTSTLSKNHDQILPSAPRGKFIVHAAGPDYTFLSKRNASQAGATDALHYGLNFKTASEAPVKDSSGDNSSTDVAREFDDIIIAN